MSAPTDEDERARVRDDVTATLFVEAGAGTGKTTSLVQRITTLVTDGHARLSQIAAITFTEAAAAQLRERIRHNLERVVADAPGAEHRRRAAEALDEVDDAPLLTLHGFANRILAAHAVEAGLPPGFEVRDAVEAGVDLDRRFNAFVAALVHERGIEPTLRAAIRMGLTMDHLRQLAGALHSSWDLVEERPPLAPPDLAGLTAPFSSAIDAALSLADSCTNRTDRLYAFLTETLAEYRNRLERDLASAGDDLARVALALGHKVPSGGNLGKAGSWVDVNAVRAAIKAIDPERVRIRRTLGQLLLADLLPLLVELTMAGAEERRRIGALEYHDLLVRARRLLREVPAVRAAVRDRYRFVLVDEFQDTDPIQVDLAVLVATPAVGVIPASVHWSDLPVEAGRLFFVGDPKQSIYRFRRADIELYDRVRDDLGKDLVRLVTNWRSVPAIVDAVNGIFRPWFESQGAGQAPWTDLVAGRPAEPGGGIVAVLGEKTADIPAEQVREMAAGDVARTVQAAVRQGWPVRDQTDPEMTRAPRLDDITVLIPTRTALPSLERSFTAAGIPYRVEARSLVWDTQEVRDLLSALRAVADPGDAVAAIAALTSGVLARSWADLHAWKLANGTWRHDQPGPTTVAARPVGAAMAALRAWSDRASWVEPAVLLEEIVRERRLLESAFARTRQRESWNRIRFLVEQARQWSDAGGRGLGAFVDWAERQKVEQAQALESVVPDADDEAVRILTIHSAKGLEFPITIVAGLSVKRAGPMSPAIVLWGKEGHPELKCGARERHLHTFGYEALESIDNELAERELTRLVYVACTRAMDHLVVSVHRKGQGRSDVAESTLAGDLDTWSAGLPGIVRGIDALEALETGPLGRAPVAAPTVDPIEPALITAGLLEAVARRERAIASSRVPLAIAATAVAHTEAPFTPGAPAMLDLGPAVTLEPEPTVADTEVPAERPGASGTTLGLAVHAVLEEVSLDADRAAIASAAALAAARHGADALATTEAVTAALGSRAVVAALASPRVWRELFVAASVEGLVVEGFVDLLHAEGDDLVVVDWKTDRVSDDADRQAKVTVYAVQLAVYALALEASTGKRVRRLSLVFCGHGVPHQVDVEGADLEDARTRARARIRALAPV